MLIVYFGTQWDALRAAFIFRGIHGGFRLYFLYVCVFFVVSVFNYYL